MDLHQAMPWAARALLVASWTLLAPSAAAEDRASEARRRFEVARPPGWVLDNASAAPSAEGGDGSADIRWLLFEEQTRLDGRSLVRYRRQIRQVRTAGGVQDGSEVRIVFDPSWQRLTLHHIRLVRGGRTIDALRPDEIKVIQQERELDRRIYNGDLTAVAFLKDVRVGDVIDVAWSLTGQHPTLEGHLVEGVTLGSQTPVERVYHRLLVPKGTRLAVKLHRSDARPKVRELDDAREYVWDLRDTRPIEVDDRLPAWFDPYPWAQASTFMTWSDVIAWALPLYESKASPDDEAVRRLIDEIGAKHRSKQARLLAATRLVQEEVRYLGMEVGAESLEPRPPAVVLQQRFGDCKDKALLLSTLLRGLGVDAHPALVHTYLGPALDEMLPSPSDFNHVIVRAVVGNKVYWIDPTEPRTRARLEDLAAPPYRRALVLRPGQDALTVVPLPLPAAPEVVVLERYRIKRYDRPVVLEVETTYRGATADEQRRYFATTTKKRLEKGALNFYARSDPDITLAAPLEIVDDPKRNVVVVKERYRIPGFWTENSRTFHAWEVTSRLDGPAVVRRSAPLSINHPQFVRHDIEVHLPEDYAIEDMDFETGDDALRFRARGRYVGNVLKLRYELRTLADHVPADRTDAHLDTLARIHENASYSIWRGGAAPGPDDREEDEDADTLLGLSVLGGCCGTGLCVGGLAGFIAGLLVPLP